MQKTPQRLEEAFYVGEYLVEPALQRVTRDDQSVQVEPKVMEVLLVLARHHEQPVSKQQFLDEVWGGTVVTEDALLRCISELRKVFGDDPRDPSYIETIRKRGYRLIAPLRENAGRRLSAARGGASPNEASWPTIWLAVSLTAVATLVLVWVLQSGGEPIPTGPLRVTPLTSYPGEETDPMFSPAGEHVAFVWDEGGTRDIYITKPGTPTPARFTSDAADDFSPSWMPGGASIVYVRADGSTFRLLSKPLGAGSERELVVLRARDVSKATLSPDGQTLAVSIREESGGPYIITLISLETGERRVLDRPPDDYLGDRLVTFSPEGRRLAFVRSIAEKVDDVYTISVGGQSLTRITADHAEVTGLDWASDGAHLIFSSNREGINTLWRVAAAGGQPVWMPTSTEGSDVTQVSADRNGGRMAVVVRSEETNIWSMPIGAGETVSASPVVASTRLDGDPHVSPDNRRLAFISNRLGHYEVWISSAAGSNPIQLTELGGPFTSTPRWDPNGERIAFVARSEGQIDVYVADVPGGRARRITTAGSNDRQPQWSRDGEWIYFTSNRTGAWDIWKRPVDGGEPVRVTENGGFAAMESADGRWVYYVKRDEPGIWRNSAEGGQEELIVERLEPFDWGNWAIEATGLYYIDRSGAQVRLMRCSPEGDDAEAVARFDGLPKEPSLSIATDGRRVYYTRVDRRGSDIVLLDER